MGRASKLIEKILAGKSDNNIRFNELCSLTNINSFRVEVFY